jgi:hypothetical protein
MKNAAQVLSVYLLIPFTSQISLKPVQPNIAIVCDACNVSNALQFQNVRKTLKKVF